MARGRQARKLSCYSCKADLTATKQLTTRDMGNKGERTFKALRAPFRIEVVITIPKTDTAAPKVQSFWFCEACKDIPGDAMTYITMQKNERNPDPNAERGTTTPFLKLA